MKSFSADLARDLYQQELFMLLNEGSMVKVRNRDTMEALDVFSEVKQPWHHCILIPERRWNPWLALSEFLWIMAGRDDVKALKPYNSHISDYSDDGSRLYGAYGKRMYGQIDSLVGRLKQDSSDRRAVLSIWESHDLMAATKDPPCNNLVYFKLRAGFLHMTVMCRSNDLHWGLFAVNIPTFGLLQEYIASRLGVKMGTQAHLSNSLHVYTDDKRASAITQRMVADPGRPAYPEHRMAFERGELDWVRCHEDWAGLCSNALA